MTLIEKLIEAGYPRDEMYHHYSDLYVFITPLTIRVVDEWFKEQGYNKDLFVSRFTDNVTGKPMYDKCSSITKEVLKMTYQRKTRDIWQLFVNYRYGWEHDNASFWGYYPNAFLIGWL